ncbi:MAG: asparagine synthase (glutamine-hydrolyzing) [Verrucomicrobia bacterium]|nr:asparagine synthase (glutamine-hydrolyzing) [Verrucomicrobiota bacterium]
MCGIAGKVRWQGQPVLDAVERMVARLRHRGPDFQRCMDVDGVAAFGHARLSIIDLSPLGHQPMQDDSGRFTLTYNGEVYNFRELRAKLEQAGHRFRSTSDTEVVLHALAAWGPRACERFNGMFALAFWDRETRELLLARDRFGKKPLFFTQLDGTFTFASELSALRADPGVGPRLGLSIAALNHYLALGYVLSPLTIHPCVESLEPATFLRVKDGRIAERTRYWDYRACFDSTTREGEQDIVRHLDDLFDQAVRRRLVADTPIGAFLSGGVDSSSVVARMRKYLPYDLHSFSVGFEEATYDESPDAQRMAQTLGTIHHHRMVPSSEGPALMERAVGRFDAPFADTSLVPMVEVSRVAAEHLKVVLSGDGADELFGGYPTYVADSLKRKLDALPRPLRRVGAAVFARAWTDTRKRLGVGFKVRQFAKGLTADPHYAHYVWRELFNEPERIAILGPQHAEEIRATHPFAEFRRHYEEARGLDPLAQHLYVDAKTWLVDDILVKVDRATMAFSLEARAPYLDADLAAYVASIPSRLKVRGRRGKWILKRMLAPHLPPQTLAKPKAGFNAPINSWLNNTRDTEFRFFARWVLDHFGAADAREALQLHWEDA